jgi:hypothetical protein
VRNWRQGDADVLAQAVPVAVFTTGFAAVWDAATFGALLPMVAQEFKVSR